MRHLVLDDVGGRPPRGVTYERRGRGDLHRDVLGERLRTPGCSAVSALAERERRRARRSCRRRGCRCATAPVPATSSRTKRATPMFSPSLATISPKSSSTVMPRAALGLRHAGRSTSVGRRRRRSARRAAATKPVNSALRPTKSVSQLTSTSTPILPSSAHERGDGALVRGAAGLLGERGQAARAQDVDGRVDVAVGLGERLLAVHHARAGALAELLDHAGGDLSHRYASRRSVSRVRRVMAVTRVLVAAGAYSACSRRPRAASAASASLGGVGRGPRRLDVGGGLGVAASAAAARREPRRSAAVRPRRQVFGGGAAASRRRHDGSDARRRPAAVAAAALDRRRRR